MGAGYAMNGCEFDLSRDSGEPESGTMGIVNCDAPITYQFANFLGDCKAEVGEQQGLEDVSFDDSVPGGDLEIDAQVSGLAYTLTGNLCPDEGTFSNGGYLGAWVADETGLVAPGDGSLGGEALTAQTLEMPGIGATLRCNSLSYGGDLPVGESSALVTPSYGKCSLSMLGLEPSALVDIGGCDYVYDLGGDLSIAGAGCASNPIAFSIENLFGSCTVTIGPQSDLASVEYANVGEGAGRAVEIDADASGVTYTAEGSLCEDGTFEDGTLSGASKLTAEDDQGIGKGLWFE